MAQQQQPAVEASFPQQQQQRGGTDDIQQQQQQQQQLPQLLQQPPLQQQQQLPQLLQQPPLQQSVGRSEREEMRRKNRAAVLSLNLTSSAPAMAGTDYLMTTPEEQFQKRREHYNCEFVFDTKEHDASPCTAAEAARGLVPTVYYKAVKDFSMPPKSNVWWFVWLQMYNNRGGDNNNSREITGLVMMRNISMYQFNVPAGTNLRSLLRLPAGLIEFQMKFLLDPRQNIQVVPPQLRMLRPAAAATDASNNNNNLPSQQQQQQPKI